LLRYSDDSFTSSFVSTVGIDFKVKTVHQHDKRIKLQIWVSTSSQPLCHGVVNEMSMMDVDNSGL